MKPINLLIVLLFFSFISKAQEQQCAFDVIRQQQRQNSNFVELERRAEEKIKSAIQSPDFYSRSTAGSVITIPVVVHVLHLGEAVGSGTNISDAQIQSSIDNLNDYYRGQIPTSPIDFEIEFVLAQSDPSCNATTGINRIDASGVPGYLSDGVSFEGAGAEEGVLKDLSRWPETDYFNIWIVTEIDGNNGGFGYQGYANFYYGSAYEGSVMMYSVFGYDPTNANPSWPLHSARDNGTVVHEAGHYFHLFHTFQGDDGGGTCPGDNVVGTDSDGCADTVPHKRETSTCPAINSCTLAPWVDNNTINNIMSYYYCADRLTNDQKTRVRAAMEGTSIANSKASESPNLSYASPSSVCAINTATNLTNSAGIVNVELNGVTFSSSTTGEDGGNINNAANCNNYFEIDTAISNTINVDLWINFHQLGIWIDWNDDGDFDDEAEQQHLSQDIEDYGSVSVALTYPTVIPYGEYVRVRLITELDDRYGFPVLSSACPPSLVYGQYEDYSIYIKPGGPVTYTYDNGWLPSDPIGVSNSSDTIIIESGTANISADTNCNTLTVNPGAALTIDSGVTLTATTVDLNSTSQLFSSLISDGTITGVVNYHKYTSQIGTNDLISAPISGQLFPAFAALNTNLAAAAITIRAFAPYNTSVGAYQNYDVAANALTTIDAGTGYRAATTDGSNLTFTGIARTDDVLDVPISDAAAGYAWNLIGNPYPSYIDFETFFTTNASEFDPNSAFQAIYGYDGDVSNGWTVWNLATIADGTVTELIAPGQAFFVKSKSGGGMVDFTKAMRRTGSSDDFIVGRNSSANVVSSQLNLTSTSKKASTQIYFIEGTTRGLDVGYDAGSYNAGSVDFSIFSNLVEDNTGVNMTIQSLPYNDFNDIIIPLGIKANANEDLTISIDNISALPVGVNIYLEDSFENSLTLLNDNAYTFNSPSELNGTGRFYLRYSSAVLSTKTNEFNHLHIYATSKPKEIVISGALGTKTEAKIYDLQGRLVLYTNLETTNTSNYIDVSTLSSGIYIVKVFDAIKVKTKKIIIN